MLISVPCTSTTCTWSNIVVTCIVHVHSNIHSTAHACAYIYIVLHVHTYIQYCTCMCTVVTSHVVKICDLSICTSCGNRGLSYTTPVTCMYHDILISHSLCSCTCASGVPAYDRYRVPYVQVI